MDQDPKKKKYITPVLHEYGGLSVLTLSMGSGDIMDNTGKDATKSML